MPDKLKVISIEFEGGPIRALFTLLGKTLNGLSYVIGWLIGTLLLLLLGGVLTVSLILWLGGKYSEPAAAARDSESVVCVEHVTIDSAAVCVLKGN